MKKSQYKTVRDKVLPSGKIKKVYTYSREVNHRHRRNSTIPNKRSCAKRHAHAFNIEFNITTEYLRKLWDDQKGLCRYSGLPLQNIGDGYFSPSIDRIDNSKGYVEGNVQWILWRVNDMKKNMHEKDFLELCMLISRGAETILKGSTSETYADGSAWQPNTRLMI